ncbi:CGG triplet repeat-binding protein 1-like [Rhizophagus irregularis DAOM 181602=DAOM 197198]|nr:CGG triplet repeat-binding protein 1-like [Rhizophagus irregularis DAOM 181602=DAOM 197198]
MPKKQKTSSVYTRCNEYKDIFRVDDNVLFCNHCNISIDWKCKSTVDNHCKSQKHIFNTVSESKNNLLKTGPRLLLIEVSENIRSPDM